MNRLPAEWEPHEALLLALPHPNTDWNAYLEDSLSAYRNFIEAIVKFEPVVLLCHDKTFARKLLGDLPHITYIQATYNDTWCRDYGPIDVVVEGKMHAFDFTFTAWGGKFDSTHDNAIPAFLHKQGVFKGPLRSVDFILEGGSIESDGRGTLLSTKTCLLNPNRNAELSLEAIEQTLQSLFGLKRTIWLSQGHLEGDDTDAHIDTLARFIDPETIAYVKCEDEIDSHYTPLLNMEAELQKTDYKLLPLPLPSPVLYEEARLPATYANFVFVNGGLIVPTYNQPTDALALQLLQVALPHLEVVGVDASVFIRQHGSLHCACMQRLKR
jgi:agmatine/peptidylarginine deiminase